MFGLVYPIVADECNVTPSSSLGSFMVTCSSDGDSASIIEYSSDDCSGDIINTTIPRKNFYCNATNNGDDCVPIVMSITQYLDSTDYSGTDIGKESYLYLVPFDDECLTLRYFGTDGYFQYTIDTDGLFVETYDEVDCDGGSEGSFNISDGLCDIYDGNSTGVSFTEDTGGSGGGGDRRCCGG